MATTICIKKTCINSTILLCIIFNYTFYNKYTHIRSVLAFKPVLLVMSIQIFFKILTVYNFHISNKDLVIEYMYPIYNSILLEYVCIQIYAPIITKIIIFMTIIVFKLRYESCIYGIIIIISMAIFQYNNRKPTIAMHVTRTHTHNMAAQHYFPVKNKSPVLHFQHMNINISYI